MSTSTSRGDPLEATNDFATLDTSRNAIPSDGPQPRFDKPHQPIQHETHQANGQNGEEDVRIDQAVVLLPEKTADAR
jgi:hypothetical protein